ncbi:MAG: glycosyltransferase [Chloroflexi bacterium]|nr:glycosyltransferase [Chloroflexota bacterium]
MESIANTHKPVVAHLRTPYLLLTETFIYRFLKHIHRFQPVVLTMDKQNEEIFPFRDVYLISAPRIFRAAWQRLFRFESSVLKYAPWYPGHIKAIQRYQVNLLHAHFGTTGYFAWPLKRFHRLPLVTSFYGTDVSRVPKQPRWPLRYRRLFASGDTGIDLDDFAYQPRQKPDDGDTIKFLIIGRFIELKGHQYTIKAYAQVHHRYPNTELRILGDGPLRPEIEQLINDLEITDSVRLLGSNVEVKEELERCHLLVQASATTADGYHDGAPVTLLEAQAVGMPVIGTLHAGIPEEIVDGETGFLVPEKDVDALAAKMMFLVEHAEIWNEMGKKGRRFMEQHFNVRVETKKLEEIYEQALAEYKPYRAASFLVNTTRR